MGRSPPPLEGRFTSVFTAPIFTALICTRLLLERSAEDDAEPVRVPVRLFAVSCASFVTTCVTVWVRVSVPKNPLAVAVGLLSPPITDEMMLEPPSRIWAAVASAATAAGATSAADAPTRAEARAERAELPPPPAEPKPARLLLPRLRLCILPTDGCACAAASSAFAAAISMADGASAAAWSRTGGLGSGVVTTSGMATSTGNSFAASMMKSACKCTILVLPTASRCETIALVAWLRATLNAFIVHLSANAGPTLSFAPATLRGCGASAAVGAPR